MSGKAILVLVIGVIIITATIMFNIEAASTRLFDEGTGFHDDDLGVNIQVFLQLSLDVLGHVADLGQVTAHNVAIVQLGFEAIGEAGFGQQGLGSFGVEVPEWSGYHAGAAGSRLAWRGSRHPAERR